MTGITMTQMKTETPSSAEQAYADILPKIKELQELSGENLEGAMKDLKKALMANPAAATLMLPEDIGELVSALRRITGQAVTEAVRVKAPTKQKKPKMLSQEEMQSAFDEL